MSGKGFTLAELLIALAILGVIATFTIPKVLTSQQSTQNRAVAKEAAASFVNAFALYVNDYGQPSNNASWRFKSVTPYLNYVKLDVTSVGQMDGAPGDGCLDCDSNSPCLKLHNGGMARFWDNPMCGSGTGTLDVVGYVTVDPTPGCSGTPGVEIWIYGNQRVSTWGSYLPNTCGWGTSSSSNDPSWFSW